MGTVNAGLFTSTTDEWPTPQDLYDTLHAEFGFGLDPCADHSNAKCPRYFTRDDDGLTQNWAGTVFMNPPYGREMKRWIKKAHDESLRGATVVCLIPARTDTTASKSDASKRRGGNSSPTDAGSESYSSPAGVVRNRNGARRSHCTSGKARRSGHLHWQCGRNRT